MTIDERLEKLETKLIRANRSYFRLLFVLALCGGIAVFAGILRSARYASRVREEFRTQRLVLEDKDGKLRGVLCMTSGAGLMLCDQRGTPRIQLDAGDARLTLFDEKGGIRAFLQQTEETVGLELFGKDFSPLTNNSPCLEMQVEDSGAALRLFGENFKPRAALSSSKEGAVIALMDDGGTARTWLTSLGGGPQLNIGDINGTVRATLGAGKIIMPDGKSIVYPESSLLLFGADGKVLWQTP